MRIPPGSAVLWLLLASAGCSSDEPRKVTLSPRDFTQSAPAVGPAVTLGPSTARIDQPPARGPELTGPIAASEGILDVSASVGEPELGASDTGQLPVTALTLVDGVVGTVNNRAIYINEFLEGDPAHGSPGARLRAEATRMSRDAWYAFARGQISKELNRMIEDELLLAEARASFVTPEQRANLRAYLESLKSNILSGAGGSRKRADEKLMEKEGRSVDEEIRYRGERDLISSELDRIDRRISVPFREVALSYERQYDKFNPPARAEFRMIRVASSRTEDVAKVARALDTGEAFASIAALPTNGFESEKGGLCIVALDRDFASTQLFRVRALDTAAHTLTPGKWTGPIVDGSFTFWLFLERIDRTTMSLYDAQLALEAGLRGRLSAEARAKLIQRLKDRASFTNFDVMVNRLVDAAAERYLPPKGP